MRCIYYKTIRRNEYSGDTWFYIQPTEACDYVKDGLLLCNGNINPYLYKTKLMIDGDWTGSVYKVNHCTLATGDLKDTEEFIRSAVKLSDAQIAKLSKYIGNDIFSFAKQKDAKVELCSLLPEKKSACTQIITKAKRVIDHEELYITLSKVGVPYDRIEMLEQYSLQQICSNPYQYLRYTHIKITSIDQIANELTTITPYDKRRLNGFLHSTMQQVLSNGNTCMPVESYFQLYNHILKQSIYPDKLISFAMFIYLVENNSDFEIQDNMVILKSVKQEEEKLISNIKRLNSNIVDQKINYVLGINYNKGQKEASKMIETSGVKILTGPPGSGKTTLIKDIVDSYKNTFPKRRVCLAATTGRASQVLSSACKHKAQTIHKWLDIKPYGENISCKNRNNPLDADLIIVDEVSMLSLSLAVLFLEAIKTGATVILVGDVDQLESVEYGNVLQDLMQIVKVYELTEIVRNDGSIIQNAIKIKNRNAEIVFDDKTTLRKESSQELLLNAVLQSYHNQIILTPIRKGYLGVEELNNAIQQISNKGDLCLEYGPYKYYQNEPVIMNITNYQKGYYNGDIGRVVGLREDGLCVNFNGKDIILNKNDYYWMEHAYAITVHKAQGSEFDDASIVMPEKPANMLTNRIFYTAYTRGKKHVDVYSVNDAYKQSIERENKQRITLFQIQMKNC